MDPDLIYLGKIFNTRITMILLHVIIKGASINKILPPIVVAYYINSRVMYTGKNRTWIMSLRLCNEKQLAFCIRSTAELFWPGAVTLLNQPSVSQSKALENRI